MQIAHLEVRHLKLVAAVAEEGSVTKAGERLHLTQSALSHQLLDIEERLGTPLFHRVSKRMLLTPSGQRLLDTAKRVLVDLGQAEEDLRRFADEREGVIRITTECYTNYHWLPELMQRFQRKHPRVDLQIDPDATYRPAESLLAGTIDLAIMSSEVADRRLQVRRLFDDEMVVVMKAGHELASRDYVRPKELAAQTLLTYNTLEENFAYQRLLRPAGLMPRAHKQVRLTEAAIELVRAGMGVSVLSRWAVAPQLASGTLVARPLTSRGLRRQWKAVTLRAARSAGYLDDFIKLLVQSPSPRLRGEGQG